MKDKVEDKLKEVFENYPYLHKKILPLNAYLPIVLEGYLVTKQECIDCKIRSESDAKYFSFYARIFIRLKYKYEGIEVYDLYQKIDVNFIYKNYPEHLHFNEFNTVNGNLICTHINGCESYSDNIIFENINSAHFYYLNYINLKNGNTFNMKEYSHGSKGLKEFNAERKKQNGRKK